MYNQTRVCQENLYDLLANAYNAEEDLTLEMMNRLFDNLDNKDICAYHDIASFNNLAKNNSNSLLLLHLNMRSIVEKMDDLDAFINSLAQIPDVIAFSESWLKSTNSKFYNLPDYTSYHVTREGKKGGGASILVKSCINSEVIEEFSYVHKDIEICTVILRVNCSKSNSVKKIVISAIYRPHGKHKRVNEFIPIISNILSKPLFLNNNVYIMGDFNINLLEIFKHGPTLNFLNEMQSFDFFELISRPTRFPKADRAKPSLLDHIYTNNYNHSIPIVITVSDHLPIFLIVPNTKPKIEKKLTKFRLFDEHSKNQFTRALSGVHWEEILSHEFVETNYNVFHNKLNEIYNEHFQIKTKVITDKRKSSPWLSKGIMNSIRTKNKL